ncbi:PaaI family thioesterase [Eilatimonas milleporae]|uniref:Uncharacterized protein (TIGR00369 family) n=1 Tax=Eilatimonas milleporae TaxID=911205 RepID=A0A3M0CXY5_9PROT|nr:PaaI family thioesterase [Eilatimonas milleporae]RMB12506.1 uncharacterized protein (TIGR00369 family) [Eilatimonas milleporae]
MDEFSETPKDTIIPSLETLGGRVVDVDEAAGRCRLEFNPTPSMCNPYGYVQGGFVAAMLDDACGVTAFLCAGRRRFTTGHMNVDFLAGVRPGHMLTAEAELVRNGARQCVVDARLMRDGTLLARGTCHQIYMDTRRITGDGKDE